MMGRDEEAPPPPAASNIRPGMGDVMNSNPAGRGVDVAERLRESRREERESRLLDMAGRECLWARGFRGARRQGEREIGEGEGETARAAQGRAVCTSRCAVDSSDVTSRMSRMRT